MRLYLQYIVTLIVTLSGFQLVYAQIDTLKAEEGNLGAIIKTCAYNSDLKESMKCTNDHLRKKLFQQLKTDTKIKDQGSYYISYLISSYSEPKVIRVIKSPRTVNKGDEEILASTFQKIILKEDWVPIKGQNIGFQSSFKINLEELKEIY